jgi:hypothetical protein
MVPEVARMLSHNQSVVVLIACGAYGIYRIVAFHPAWRDGYMSWLKTTPWSARQPLPLGPIHLVWSDALVVLAGEALLMRWPVHLHLAGVVCFLAAYLFFLMVGFLCTGQIRFAWAILFGLGLLTLCPTTVSAVPLVFGLYGVGYLGIRRSLEAFPWPLDNGLLQVNVETAMRQRAAKSGRGFANLGWPFGRLQGFELKPAIRCETGLLLSLLPAWYLFLILRRETPDEALWFVAGAAGAGACLIRVCIYTCGCAPPISLLGRLATGRWIIPGYDRVLVAPLLAVAAGVGLPPLLDWAGVMQCVAIPIGVAASFAIALNAGPTLSTWRLAGDHRLTPYGLDRSTFVRP